MANVPTDSSDFHRCLSFIDQLLLCFLFAIGIVFDILLEDWPFALSMLDL